MKTCREIMTENPKCATAQRSIEEVAQMMKEEDVGAIPIVDDESNRKLIGIVTDRDIVLKVVADHQDPGMVRADAVMSSELAFCHPQDNLAQAMEAMEDHQVRRLPVVDGEQKLIGIIAQKDLAESNPNFHATGEMLKEISRD
ncbi:MAG TPA: CBS domain-containing protein [bacterium]|nr:CBS domain-containing protein [bacterium]